MAHTLHLIQLTSTADVQRNLDMVAQQMATVAPQPGDLVLLPECFAVFAGGAGHQLRHAEVDGDGPIQQFLAALARQYAIYLVGGTVPIRSGNKHAAACLVYDPLGMRCARYDKIHLFDVTVADGTGNYRESDTTVPGRTLGMFNWRGVRVGLMVCYDLRFPELARHYAQAGCQLLLVPAAFTRVTGEAHWQVLLQARAIENQLVVAAADQTGLHDNGRETWGHSLVVDGWGRVLADAGEGVGAIRCTPPFAELATLRAQMPLAQHNRFSTRFLDAAENNKPRPAGRDDTWQSKKS